MASASKGYSAEFLWTGGSFLVSAILKFGLNVALSRLLAPDILGIMVVVNAVRLGVDLLTDVGIEQNIVHHEDSLEPAFRATAWTMQLIRGVLLSVVFFAIAPFLAHSYGIDVRIFMLAALSPMIAGAHSIAVFALVKQVNVRRRNLFELSSELLAFLGQVFLAAWLRSVWAPAIGVVLAVVIRTVLSYTLPRPWERLQFSIDVVRRILRFGKWIAITSLLMYAASNLDRLYLGKLTGLALLGSYGIARAIAELPTTLARRMGYQIIFPALAGAAEQDFRQNMAIMARSRAVFALAACVGITIVASTSDLLIGLVYDPRYAQAGWILSVLLLGSVFSVLSSLNEALLLTAGQPRFSTLANAMRLITLAVLLPVGFAMAGFPGAVVAVAATEPLQYLYIAFGLARVRLQFWRGDAIVVAVCTVVYLIVLVGRITLGGGHPLMGVGFGQ